MTQGTHCSICRRAIRRGGPGDRERVPRLTRWLNHSGTCPRRGHPPDSWPVEDEDMTAITAVASAGFNMGIATAHAMLRNRTFLDAPSRETIELADALRAAGYPNHANVVAGLPSQARAAVAAPADTIDGVAVDVDTLRRKLRA